MKHPLIATVLAHVELGLSDIGALRLLPDLHCKCQVAFHGEPPELLARQSKLVALIVQHGAARRHSSSSGQYVVPLFSLAAQAGRPVRELVAELRALAASHKMSLVFIDPCLHVQVDPSALSEQRLAAFRADFAAQALQFERARFAKTNAVFDMALSAAGDDASSQRLHRYVADYFANDSDPLEPLPIDSLQAEGDRLTALLRADLKILVRDPDYQALFRCSLSAARFLSGFASARYPASSYRTHPLWGKFAQIDPYLLLSTLREFTQSIDQ